MALNISKLFRGRGGNADNLALSGDVDPSTARLTPDAKVGDVAMLNNKYPENLSVRDESNQGSSLVADNDEASDVDESAEVGVEESLGGSQPSDPSGTADPATSPLVIEDHVDMVGVGQVAGGLVPGGAILSAAREAGSGLATGVYEDQSDSDIANESSSESSIAFKEAWAEVRDRGADGRFGPETEAVNVLSGSGSGTDEQARGAAEVDSSAGPVSVVEDATDVILNVRGQPATGIHDIHMNQGSGIVTDNKDPDGFNVEADGKFGPGTEAARVLPDQGSGTFEQVVVDNYPVESILPHTEQPAGVTGEVTGFVSNVPGRVASAHGLEMENGGLDATDEAPGILYDGHAGVGAEQPPGFDRGYISPSAAVGGAEAPFDPAHPFASEFRGSDEQMNFLIGDLRERGLIDTSTGEIVWADEASPSFTGSDEELGSLIAWLQQKNLIDTSTGEIVWARQPVGEADGFMVWNGETVSHGVADPGTQESAALLPGRLEYPNIAGREALMKDGSDNITLENYARDPGGPGDAGLAGDPMFLPRQGEGSLNNLIDTSTGEIEWADEASAEESSRHAGPASNLIDTSTGEIVWADEATQGVVAEQDIWATDRQKDGERGRQNEEDAYQVGGSPEVADAQAMSAELMFDAARVSGGRVDLGSFERRAGPGVSEGQEANLDVYGGNSGSPAVEFESQTRPHADGFLPEVEDEVLVSFSSDGAPDSPPLEHVLQAREANAMQDVFVTELVGRGGPAPDDVNVSVGGFGGGVDDERINDQTPADWNERGMHRPDGAGVTLPDKADVDGHSLLTGAVTEYGVTDGGSPFIVPAENANGLHEDDNGDGDFDDPGETSRRSFGLNNGFDQEGTSAGVVDETVDGPRQGVWGQLPPDRASADHPLQDDMAFLSGAGGDGQAPGVTNARELALDDLRAPAEEPPNDAASFKTLSGMDSETEAVDSTSSGSRYIDTGTTAEIKYETEVTDYRESDFNQFNPKEVSVDRLQADGDRGIKFEISGGTGDADMARDGAQQAKWQPSELDSSKNEVSIESVEIAHEGRRVISLDTWEHGVHDGPSTLLAAGTGDDDATESLTLNFEEVTGFQSGPLHEGDDVDAIADDVELLD